MPRHRQGIHDDGASAYNAYPQHMPAGYEPGEFGWAYGQPPPEKTRRVIPWQTFVAAALALLTILLWILQAIFARQTERAITDRALAAEAIQAAHPYAYRELIETQGQVRNLHPAFLAAVILNESSFRPDAESSAGARGLMQMMPDTAEWVHGKIGEGTPFHFDSMYDPSLNVRYACWYMNYLSESFYGDPILVAAAFHSGQGTVRNWLNDSRYSLDGRTIELERMMEGPTRNYVTRVLRAYAVYKRLYYENPAL